MESDENMQPESADKLIECVKKTDEVILRIHLLDSEPHKWSEKGYLHEKWNDLQNSPFITRKTADRLRLIAEEAHKRGIKVIPYFGYEISSLSPYWHKMGEEIMNHRLIGLSLRHSLNLYCLESYLSQMIPESLAF